MQHGGNITTAKKKNYGSYSHIDHRWCCHSLQNSFFCCTYENKLAYLHAAPHISGQAERKAAGNSFLTKFSYILHISTHTQVHSQHSLTHEACRNVQAHGANVYKNIVFHKRNFHAYDSCDINEHLLFGYCLIF